MSPVDHEATAMHKIFDSLKRGELAVAERKHSETAATNSNEKLDRRRTSRVCVQIPLLIYGYTPQGAPFSEEAYTIEINAHGALIAMKTVVALGERLLLTNETNLSTQDCTVLAVTARQERDVEVVIAFATPARQFWGELGQTSSHEMSLGSPFD